MSDINITVNDEVVNIDVIDTPVLVNVVNSPGQQGPAGPGVPVGGTAGQILAKASATDYDTEWINNYAKYLATNVRNQTGSTIGAFQVVYISGATGNKPLISLADADTEATSSKTYGVTSTAIANNGTGDVVTAGELTGINTSAFNEGDLLWLSTTAGGVVTTPPAEPAHAVFIGYVVRSHPTLGVIDVSIQNGYELNELHGVQITTPTDNQGLFYNATSTLWENKTISTALGYTPVPTTRNITINGVTYDLSADRTYTISTGISGSGASGQVTYWTGASAVSGSNNLFWDNAKNTLSVKSTIPSVVASVASQTFFGRSAVLYASDTANDCGFNMNFYFDGTSNRYKNNGPVSSFYLDGAGNISFFNGGSGTAGTTITSSEKFRLFNNGNVLIQNGGTFTDLGYRLGVIGDTLLRGSGNTNATTALTVQNSSSVDALKVRNDGAVIVGNFAPAAGNYPNTAFSNRFISPQFISSSDYATGMTFSGGSSISLYSWVSGNNTNYVTIGGQYPYQVNETRNALRFLDTFTGSTGSASYNAIHISNTINQTGTANGITRGLYVNPTLTAAADFRAIETTAGNVLFGSNFFWDNTNGRLGIGTNAPAFELEISKSTGATAFGAVGLRITNTSGTGEAFFSIRNQSFYAGFELFGDNYGVAGLRNTALFTTQNGVTYLGFATLGNSPIGFRTNTTSGTTNERLTILGNGNVAVNSTSDLGVRFGVVGDTLLRGSGATSATTALTVQNSSSTNLFTVRNDGNTNISNGLQVQGPLNGTLSGAGFELEYNSGISYVTSYSRIAAAWLPMILRSSDLTITTAGTNKAQFFSSSGNLVLQNGGTFTDVASSRLTVNSTTQGFLPPRMTTTQKNAIATPAAGLVVYDTTLNKLCVYTTAWETITSI